MQGVVFERGFQMNGCGQIRRQNMSVFLSFEKLAEMGGSIPVSTVNDQNCGIFLKDEAEIFIPAIVFHF